VTLLERTSDTPPAPGTERDPAAWQVAACVGGPPCQAPAEGDVEVRIDDTLTLALRGRALPAEDQRIVEAFAAQAAVALRQERLAAEAAAAKPLAEADRMRTALLAAVSHDLRTPLASAKAAITSLRSHDVQFDEGDQAELLATADESLDRLTRMVANLLDMSRLQAGALGVTPVAVGLEDAIPRALDELGPDGQTVKVELPDDLPAVLADPGLLERVLVNVVGNALRFSPTGQPPAITATELDSSVQLNVVDHGPGVPEDQRDRIFVPFQRLGDTSNETGVGLGLALSRGLVEAMGGIVVPDTTPGGGLTMRFTLPAATSVEPS
jgi:two-component system sensor histidine kinase KdpD